MKRKAPSSVAHPGACCVEELFAGTTPVARAFGEHLATHGYAHCVLSDKESLKIMERGTRASESFFTARREEEASKLSIDLPAAYSVARCSESDRWRRTLTVQRSPSGKFSSGAGFGHAQMWPVLESASDAILTQLQRTAFLPKGLLPSLCASYSHPEACASSDAVMPSLLRLMQYDSNAGCDVHVDRGLLTLIFGAAVEGVQVFDPMAKRYVYPCPQSAGSDHAATILVLAGATLERATCGLVRAVRHKAQAGSVDRISTVFSLRADPTARFTMSSSLAHHPGVDPKLTALTETSRRLR